MLPHNLLIFLATIRDNDIIMRSLYDKSVDLISKIDRSKTLANGHNWAIDRDVVDWL